METDYYVISLYPHISPYTPLPLQVALAPTPLTGFQRSTSVDIASTTQSSAVNQEDGPKGKPFEIHNQGLLCRCSTEYQAVRQLFPSFQYSVTPFSQRKPDLPAISQFHARRRQHQSEERQSLTLQITAIPH